MMLHAQCQWPQAITTHLWSYTLHMVNEIHNSLPKVNAIQSHLELFLCVPVHPSMRHFHHFGCPAYVLHEALQAGYKGKKWEGRLHIGIYLGMSPKHAHSVSLVLSLRIRLVWPQFHLSFNDLFKTMITKLEAVFLPELLWQEKIYFRALTRWCWYEHNIRGKWRIHSLQTSQQKCK